MKPPHKKNALLASVVVIMALLNYNPQLLFESSYLHWGWNASLLATVLILLIFRFRDPTDWKQKLGIDFRRTDWIGFIASTVILIIISYFLVGYLATENGFTFKPMILYYKEFTSPEFPFHPILGYYFYYVFETLNEELIIGAVLLMGLERNFRNLHKNTIAISIALFFSLMHQGMYLWSPVQSGTLLTYQTVLSLFFVGIIRNALILKTRKVAYSWAIHLAVNLVFFPGYYIHHTTHTMAAEPDKFNLVFGNHTMMILTGIFAVVSLIWMNRRAD